MPTPSPRGQEQAGGSDTPSPPQGRSPPCGRVLKPCNRNGSDQRSPCPRQYSVGHVPDNIVQVLSDRIFCRNRPVWFNILPFSTAPKHGEGRVLRRPGPCRECAANPRAEESRGGSPPPCWPSVVWPAPGCQMDARRACCWSHFNQPKPLDPVTQQARRRLRQHQANAQCRSAPW